MPEHPDEYLYHIPAEAQSEAHLEREIFSFSVKRGWCDENPILRVDTPFLQEQEIPALTLKEITQLLKAAMEEFDGSCAAGAALMIFAESARRKWNACSGKTSLSATAVSF